jgi:hypothetical protein
LELLLALLFHLDTENRLVSQQVWQPQRVLRQSRPLGQKHLALRSASLHRLALPQALRHLRALRQALRRRQALHRALLHLRASHLASQPRLRLQSHSLAVRCHQQGSIPPKNSR